MTLRRAAFAIPGDIATLTGGYIYERRLLHGLRDLGHDVQHVELGASFPDPTAQDMTEAIACLADLPPDRPLILDGLVYGSIETAGLAGVRAPIVAMIHHPLALETGLSPERQAHLFETECANLALAAHVLVPSPHTARILETRYEVAPDRITIAPPGTERAGRKRTPSEPPLILAVGIQHPRKGHDVLLRALAEIAHLPWRAVIAGGAHDAEYARELNELKGTLGLDDRVKLAGSIPQADLADFYGTASIFALATWYEGYGMVFAEALSWGLPIVTCNAGAVPETVPSDAGFLVEPGGHQPFAEALARLLNDTDLRQAMANAAHRAGQNLPTWHDTARVASTVLNGLDARK